MSSTSDVVVETSPPLIKTTSLQNLYNLGADIPVRLHFLIIQLQVSNGVESHNSPRLTAQRKVLAYHDRRKPRRLKITTTSL